MTDVTLIVMGKLISTDDGAAKLGVTSGRIRTLCRQRRIPGARFIGARWYVPEDLKVMAGTRGPVLSLAQARVVGRVTKLMKGLKKK